MTHTNYLQSIKTAIKENKAILVKDISEYLPYQLTQVLKENSKLELNSETHSTFKLYMSTRLANPHFHPDIYSLVTIVNFSATHVGLEETFLRYMKKISNIRFDSDFKHNFYSLNLK